MVGFWFARQPNVAAVFDPYVKMVNALPRVVLAPIFTLWLGLGIWSKVALGVTLVFFIVFFNVYQGVKEVSHTVLNNGRMLGMSERQLMRHVYWPSALSWMFSSLHTSVGFAVVGRLRRRLDRDRLDGAAVGLGAAMRRALRDDDEIARFHLHFLVAEPDRALALEDVLDLVGVGVQMLRRAAVLDRDGRAVHRDEGLVAHATGVGGRKRVAFEIAGMDDLRADGVGGKRRPHEMRHGAASG